MLLVYAFVFCSFIILFQSCSPSAEPPDSGQGSEGTLSSEAALKNIAFRRAVWHSSSANYDNTGQLVTDGITGRLSNEVIDYSGTSATNPAHGQMIPGKINSEWISASNGKEWVYTDFGAVSTVESVRVYWGANYAVKYDIQISDDAKAWKTVAHAAGRDDSTVETKLKPCEARYLRIFCNTSSGENYIIRELEVMGTNNVDYRIGAQPGP